MYNLCLEYTTVLVGLIHCSEDERWEKAVDGCQIPSDISKRQIPNAKYQTPNTNVRGGLH